MVDFLKKKNSNEELPQKCYNTQIVVNNLGEIVAKYRKIHLYDIDIPGVKWLESANTYSGSELVVTDSPVGKLGLSICYDLRFPELYFSLRKLGAEILLVPSAFMVKTGKSHWMPLLQARAIENQCYVLAAAESGRNNPNRESYGHTVIISPWGTILGELDGESTGLIIADIDLASLYDIRKNMNVLEHRKPNVYI